MTRWLICPQGHRWEAEEESSALRSGAARCPVCAAPHVTLMADGPGAVGSGDFELGTVRIEPGGSSDSAPETPADGYEHVLVPGYDILGVLGRGGMGVVYKARHRQLKRVVALKMILAGGHSTAEHLARFRTEAEAVARLVHPNVVQIYETGEHEGLPYFSLEFVDGESLDRRLAGTPLPPRAAAQLGETLARAMHYAHEQGVVHRDLKPSNVLLAPAGLHPTEGAVYLRDAPGKDDPRTQPEAAPKSCRSETGAHWVPKITDFGLAKQIGVDSGHTQSGSVVGTPSYMAPEQATGRVREIGPLSDVYALGAILYELLTGRPPFKGASVLETLEMVRHQEPVPPHRLQPKAPRDLETICLKCLRKDARKRYASAGELADDLHRFLIGEPIRARPATVFERAVKWARKRPAVTALIGLSAAAAVALLVLWGLFTVQLQSARDRADEQRQLAEQRERTARRLLYAARLNLAQRAWHEGQVPRMLDILAEYRHPQGEDLRGLEWFYLWGLGHGELAVCRDHAGPVLAVAFSPDGARLVSAGDDGRVRVWEAAADAGGCPGPLLTLDGPGGEVRCVAFSPDGQLLAVGTRGRSPADAGPSVTVWDAPTGQELFRLSAHPGGVSAVAFSPDGKTLATAGPDRTVKLWDVARRKERLTLRGHLQMVQGLGFSPKGDRLVTASLDRTVRLWDAATGRELRVLPESDSPMRCAAWSPDGRRIAAGGGSQMQPFGEVRLWDAETGAALGTLRGHTAPVFGLAFEPSGRLLASASHDGTARVWDVAGGRLLRTFRGHSRPVSGVAFRPDGQVLATGGNDGTVRLWDVVHGREETTLPHESTVSSVAFSPDGRRLAVAESANKISLWSLDGPRPRADAPLDGHTDKVRCVAFGRSGGAELLASGGDDQTVKMWDAASGREVRTLTGHAGSVRGVALSADGRLLASCGTDTTVRLWEVSTGKPLRTLTGHSGPVNAVALAPDGKRVASAGADGTVRVWDAESGKELLRLEEESGAFSGVAFSPDARRVAASHRGGAAKVWDAATGELQLELRGHAEAINAVAFSPDGQRLATAGDDQTVRLWDAVTGQELLLLTAGPVGAENWVTAVCFGPDGRRLASGSADRKVRLWEGRGDGE